MEPRNIGQKIDEAAETAKRAIAIIDDTRNIASQLAGALITNAQVAIKRASTKGENRLTEHVTKAAHRLEEAVTRFANRTEEWADKAAGRSQAAAERSSRRATRWLQPKEK